MPIVRFMHGYVLCEYALTFQKTHFHPSYRARYARARAARRGPDAALWSDMEPDMEPGAAISRYGAIWSPARPRAPRRADGAVGAVGRRAAPARSGVRFGGARPVRERGRTRSAVTIRGVRRGYAGVLRRWGSTRPDTAPRTRPAPPRRTAGPASVARGVQAFTALFSEQYNCNGHASTITSDDVRLDR